MDDDVWFDVLIGSDLFWIALLSETIGSTAFEASGDLVAFPLVDDMA